MNPNIVNKLGKSPLFIAIKSKNMEIFTFMVDIVDVDVNICDNKGNSPLHKALKHNNHQMCWLLLEAGANPNKKNIQGFSPFELLIQKYKSKNLGYQSFIEHFSTFMKHKAIVKELTFPIKISTKTNLYKDFVFKKKKKITKIEEEKPVYNFSPLIYFVAVHNEQNFDLIKNCLSNGLSVNERDTKGLTSLNYAIIQNNTNLVDLYCKQKDIDLNMIDNDGKTPVHWAVCPIEWGSYENKDIIKILINIFNINAKDNFNKSPLYYAKMQVFY